MTLQKLPDGTTNPAWVKVRQGKLGGSTIGKIITQGSPGKLTKGAITLARMLAVERYYERSFDYAPPDNPDIKRGNEHESIAIAKYSMARGVMTAPARWVDHPTIDGAGATPDAFPPGGLVQVKCPRRDNFCLLMLDGEFPSAHVDQMQWEMACTGRPWNDLAVYCDEQPEGEDLIVRRLHADRERIEVLETQARLFLAEVEAVFDKLPKLKLIEEI